MSLQLEKDPGERKLRVTLLSAEWKTSRNGDLTTINRELAIQMAKHPNVEVSVFLPQCSEEDKKSADSKYNVKLIEAVEVFGREPVDWLASVPDGHVMDCVVGHGVALGWQIQLIKKNPNYSHCKWIQVVHSAPEEIGMYKNISKGQQMQKAEIELCKKADQVVTIGPKLTKAYERQLKKQDVFNLTPSIFSEFSDVQQASNERITFCVLVTESGDNEDFDAKGYEIAAKAIANLQDNSYQLKFASKQRGKEDEIVEKLLQCGIGRNQLIVCSFDENRETLANLFCEADIALLPSRSEGFGLSALQAISAGLPLLVSENSGIAEALRRVANGSQCIVKDSEHPEKWARAIKAVRDKARNVRLAEAKDLCANYLQVYSWEEPCRFLVEKMNELVFDGKLNIKVDVEHMKLADHDTSSTPSVSTMESAGCQMASTPPGTNRKRQSDTDLEDLQPFEKKVLCRIAMNYLDTTPPRSRDERSEFQEYLQKMKVLITGVSVGSLVITVKCDSLKSLEELWENYSCGLLNKMVQDCFVTENILKELNLAELKLKTTMDIEEYNACKLYFEKDVVRGVLSSEFHSISSTSESSQKQEELKKWKQKTKIEETVEMKGALSAQSYSTGTEDEAQIERWKQNTEVVESEKVKRNTRSKKPKAPCSSNLYTVKKGKSQVSEQASDPVPDAAASPRTCDSALSTLERTKTQSVPFPATETSDNKGGVPIETKGWNSLHSAAESGNEGIIEMLLSSGLDIDSRGNDGTTPLMVAAAAGKEETVNLFLNKGANPHLKNCIGRNLLHAAAEGGNTSIVKRVLSCGIDIDSRDDEYSSTSLMIAAKFDNVEVMKYLLEKGANVSLTTESTRRNVLHIASQYGSVAAIQLLLSSDLSRDSRDSEGNTPLAYAAACGQIEAVNCLLEHGADPSLKGQDGWSLLHFAAQSGNVTIIDTMLSKGLNIDSRGETRGLTPLLVSLKNDKLEAAKHLIVKGANVSLKFKAEMNALSIAAITGSVAAIKMLLPHGFYIDSRDADGNTPSLMAAKCGNTEALNYLLAKGADPLLQNNNEFGLLHLAALSNNVATIEAVLSKKKFDINVRGSCMSLTPLLACLNMGNLEAANYLLKRGADEHIKGKEGLTALSVAARSGNVAAIQMLVGRGHDPNSRDGCDKTPIMWAVESGNRAAVEYLLRLTHEGLLPTTD